MFNRIDDDGFSVNYKNARYGGRQYDVIECLQLPFSAQDISRMCGFEFVYEEFDMFHMAWAPIRFDEEDVFGFESKNNGSTLYLVVCSLTKIAKIIQIVRYVMSELKIEMADITMGKPGN